MKSVYGLHLSKLEIRDHVELPGHDLRPLLKKEWNPTIEKALRKTQKIRKQISKKIGKILEFLPLVLIFEITDYWLDNKQEFEWIVPQNGSLLWCFDCNDSSRKIYTLMKWYDPDIPSNTPLDWKHQQSEFVGHEQWPHLATEGYRYKQIDSFLVWKNHILGIFFTNAELSFFGYQLLSDYLPLSSLCVDVSEKLKDEVGYSLRQVNILPIRCYISCHCQEKKFCFIDFSKEELARKLESLFL